VSRRRPHPLVVGLAAAPVALLAAVGAAATVQALRGDDRAPAAEVELRFAPEDREEPVLAADPSGKAVPDVALERFDGGALSLRDYRGRPVVVNFFASYCAPCETEMPALQRISDELGGRVAFLGVDPAEPVAAARALVERTGVTYDLARDPDGELFEQLGAVNLPSTFFVSSTGEVVHAHAGAIEADLVRELAAGLS
jgi:cytochrome c biogenesis protein CcmG, thiol:disulfide interchange protein DsbE